jgi:UrcA family protein
MERLTANRLALVMFGTLAFSGVALAQEPGSEFVVSSPRLSGLAHSSLTGASADVISISQRVSYADLNLATASGSREMEARVRNTAKALCEKLEQRYPLSGTSVETCVRNAVDKGMADVRAASAAAEKKARTASIGSQE